MARPWETVICLFLPLIFSLKSTNRPSVCLSFSWLSNLKATASHGICLFTSLTQSFSQPQLDIAFYLSLTLCLWTAVRYGLCLFLPMIFIHRSTISDGVCSSLPPMLSLKVRVRHCDLRQQKKDKPLLPDKRRNKAWSESWRFDITSFSKKCKHHLSKTLLHTIIWPGITVEVLTSLDKSLPKFTSRMTTHDTDVFDDMHPTMTFREEAFSTLTALVTNVPTLTFSSMSFWDFCDICGEDVEVNVIQ